MNWTYKELKYNAETYTTFPCLTSDGKKLFLVYREASQNSSIRAKQGAPTHHDNDSRILFTASHDLGVNWSEPKEIFKGKYGVNDPGITILKDGRLIVRVSEIEVKPSDKRSQLEGRLLNHRSEFAEVSAVYGNSIIISHDFGQSWEAPQKMNLGQHQYAISREPIVELVDGTLVLSLYESNPFKSEECYLVRSWDGGKSWQDSALLAKDPAVINSIYASHSYNEAAVVEMAPNHLIALIRCDESYFTNDEQDYMPVGGVGEIRIGFSQNNGLSWSVPKKTGLFGQPVACLKIGSDTLIAVYAQRKKPYQIVYCLSYNQGKTWEKEKIIKANGIHWDLGYPTVVVCGSQIVVSYYWQKPDGTRYIEVAQNSISEILK